MASDIDSSLAFTALLELHPQFAAMADHEAGILRHQLVRAWRTRPAEPQAVTFWTFAKAWIGEHS
jgi:hypothetical protein